MAREPQQQKKERDWYSVSYISAKRTIQLLLFVVMVIGAAAFYQQWENERKRTRSEELIRQASEMTTRVGDRPDAEQLRREYFTAWEALEGAKQAYTEQNYGEALNLSQRSLQEFEQMLQLVAEVEGRGRFIQVEGNVEFRRGARGTWKRARSMDIVDEGDWVKTSAGASARIEFPGGDEYTLRANTLINLSSRTDKFGRKENVATMDFGTVQLATGEAGSTVATPSLDASVQGSSEGTVSYDKEREEAVVASVVGSIEVTTEDGVRRTLAPQQAISQRGDALSSIISLPSRPSLTGPTDESDVDLKDGRLRLTWTPVEDAESYSLQISKSRLFASKVLEDAGRTTPYATLGLQREGVYYWQVAAVRDGDVQGPWSEPRVFRVANLRSASEDTPPPLAIDDVQTFGRLLIISGRTEAGVTVEVNGEEAEVQPDGSFSKTIQVGKEGFSFVEVVATDAGGRTATEQRRVFFDSSY